MNRSAVAMYMYKLHFSLCQDHRMYGGSFLYHVGGGQPLVSLGLVVCLSKCALVTDCFHYYEFLRGNFTFVICR